MRHVGLTANASLHQTIRFSAECWRLTFTLFLENISYRIEHFDLRFGDYVISMLLILNFSILRTASTVSRFPTMVEDLIKILRNASQGDPDAIEEGGLEESKIGEPGAPKLSAMSLRANHYRACMIQTSAEILVMYTMAAMCKDYIDILNVLSKKLCNIRLKEITLDPEDYTDTMQRMVEDVWDNLLPLSKSQEDQAGTSKNDANPPTDNSENCEKHDDGAEKEINIQLST